MSRGGASGFTLTGALHFVLKSYVPVNSKTIHPHPRANPGAFDFFGQIPHYVASLDGQIPHPLGLQRGTNPPPSRHVKATVETSYAKYSATTNFLLSLSSLQKQYSTI